MIVGSQHLNKDLFSSGVEHAPTRRGFGEGLLLAGQADSAVVALCADDHRKAHYAIDRDAIAMRLKRVASGAKTLPPNP